MSLCPIPRHQYPESSIHPIPLDYYPYIFSLLRESSRTDPSAKHPQPHSIHVYLQQQPSSLFHSSRLSRVHLQLSRHHRARCCLFIAPSFRYSPQRSQSQPTTINRLINQILLKSWETLFFLPRHTVVGTAHVQFQYLVYLCPHRAHPHRYYYSYRV